MDDKLKERTDNEISMMKKVFSSITLKDENNIANEFFDMASNYFKDSTFFMQKNDYLRAFEAVVISWSYIDAGLKAGLFSLPDKLKEYFTSD